MLATHHLSSQKQLGELAQQWGYDYEMPRLRSSPTPSTTLEGTIKTVTLPYGIDLCLNELTAREEDFRSGTLQESLTILLTLAGDEPHYMLDDGRTIAMEIGVARVIVARDPLRLWCRNPKGHHYRSLVIQASLHRIKDNGLASQIAQLLLAEGVYSFIVPHHTMTLACSLFMQCENCISGRLHTHSCVLDLLAQGLRAAEQAPLWAPFPAPSRDTARILQVRDKLLAQLDNNHCLCDLARDVGISVSTLKSKFHAVMGQSVFAFLREQRLIRAKQGLESEGWTVKQAAYYVGYQHPSNFSTAYRRKFGHSPHEAIKAWLQPSS